LKSYANGQKTRENIINVCKDLFFKKGYKDTLFSEICATAQVNSGSVSYHFKEKSAIAKTIYAEMMMKISQRIKELFHDEDELTILLLAICIHHWLLFHDSAYRRFSVQITSECVCDIIDDKFEHFAPIAHDYLKKNMSPEKTDFFIAAIAGADSHIEFYIDRHIETLKYEEIARYTCELYHYFLDKACLSSCIERSLELVRNLEISNQGFDISIDFKK
jgi:AcrR family transcriptional regulator